MNVCRTHVSMGLHVWTTSMDTNVYVTLVGQGFTVKQVYFDEYHDNIVVVPQ